MTAGSTRDAASWDDLVDRLAAHDICYLTGGSAWDGEMSPYAGPQDAPLTELLIDLASSSYARLRDALVALLFRHPEYAAGASSLANGLADPAETYLRAAVLAAAALREHWSFVLGIYLPEQPAIAADHVAREMGVPPPSERHGDACLRALAETLRKSQSFPFNYRAGWEQAAGHVLEQLRKEARTGSAQ